MTDKAVEIARLLAPTVASLGVELLGAEYLPGSGNAVLRLYIDLPADRAGEDADGAPRSVTIDDCEAVSREVSAQLDVEDPISGHYTLEVSSPGLDRPWVEAAHFARFAGDSAKVTLKLPQEGRRRFTGRIVEVEGDRIAFDIDGTALAVSIDNIDKARLVPDWAALGLAPHKDKPGRGAKPRPSNKKPTHQPAADKPSSAE